MSTREERALRFAAKTIAAASQQVDRQTAIINDYFPEVGA